MLKNFIFELSTKTRPVEKEAGYNVIVIGLVVLSSFFCIGRVTSVLTGFLCIGRVYHSYDSDRFCHINTALHIVN